MTSLRERIEQKSRRTEAFPILVGDASAAAAEVSTFRAALEVHQRAVADRVAQGGERTDADTAREEQLRADLSAALQRQRDTVAEVTLQSLPDDEWDAILDGLEPDEDGEYDLDDVRAVLVAASCVDEELRDAAWWEAQFERPEWTKGEKLALNQLLLRLNLNVPAGASGKG